MRIVLFFLITLFACQSSKRNGVFEIKNFKHYKLLSLDTIKSITQFRQLGWRLDRTEKSGFIVPYDFKNRKFDVKSDKGIPINTISFDCYTRTDCPSANSVKLLIDSGSGILSYDSKQLNTTLLVDLLKSNYLNFGKNPLLSEKPEEVRIDLCISSFNNLKSHEQVFFNITNAYITFLGKMGKVHKEPIKALVKKYPFLLYLREKRMKTKQ